MPSVQMHGTDKNLKVLTNCRKLQYMMNAKLFQDPSITFTCIINLHGEKKFSQRRVLQNVIFEVLLYIK